VSFKRSCVSWGSGAGTVPTRPWQHIAALRRPRWSFLIALLVWILVGTALVAVIVPSSLADGLVAGGTLALALATVGLIWDSRVAREEQEHARQAAAFQAALVEQVENCRRCYSGSPTVGTGAVLSLTGWVPSFEKVQQLLETVALPGDLAAYLVWLIARARQHHDRALDHEQERVKELGTSFLNDKLAEFVDNWRVELDYLQEVFA